MLVLGRKEDEKITIGENIEITVTRIAGNRVSIGIDAPADVRVFRSELKGSQQGPRKLPSGLPRLPDTN